MLTVANGDRISGIASYVPKKYVNSDQQSLILSFFKTLFIYRGSYMSGHFI